MSYLDGMILDVDDGDRSRMTQAPDGRWMYEAKIVLTGKGFRAMAEGYLCAHCMENLKPSGAFPEHCPTCGFPVREQQAERLAMDYIGQEAIGSRLSLSDELERMKDDMWTPGGMI